MKKEKGVKKEEDTSADVKVKKEAAAANGSLTHDARDAHHCDLHTIPEAFPRPSWSRQSADVFAGDKDDDFCVVVGERPVSVAAAYLLPSSQGHGNSRGALSTSGCGYHRAAAYCQGANLGFVQQSLTTFRSNSSELGNNGVPAMQPPSIDLRSWRTIPMSRHRHQKFIMMGISSRSRGKLHHSSRLLRPLTPT